MQNQACCRIENYKETTSYFNEHMYLFQYNGEIRNTILNYKFNEKSYIYDVFVNFLKNNQKICVQIKKYDIIVSVPISKERLKQRGYNQSELLAKKIAKMLQMQFSKDVLIKIKNNKIQSELNKQDRRKNVQNVYITKKQKEINSKKILLVDDIFTTGNTANECARILMENSAKNVGIFTIAKD